MVILNVPKLSCKMFDIFLDIYTIFKSIQDHVRTRRTFHDHFPLL